MLTLRPALTNFRSAHRIFSICITASTTNQRSRQPAPPDHQINYPARRVDNKPDRVSPSPVPSLHFFFPHRAINFSQAVLPERHLVFLASSFNRRQASPSSGRSGSTATNHPFTDTSPQAPPLFVKQTTLALIFNGTTTTTTTVTTTIRDTCRYCCSAALHAYL